MAETVYSGDYVATVVIEEEGFKEWNSVRFFSDKNEVFLHDLEMVVYTDGDEDYADAGEATLAESDLEDELISSDKTEENYEDIDDECREHMISKLTDNDIKKVRDDMSLDDVSYLDCIIRGNGFKPYGQYTNAELVAEHTEQFGSK